jgi:hypothetical protein
MRKNNWLNIVLSVNFTWIWARIKSCPLYCACTQVNNTQNHSGWWMHCLQPILFELAPTFMNMMWNINVQVPRPKYALHICRLGHEKGFKCTMYSVYKSIRIKSDTIFCVWKLCKGSKIENNDYPSKIYKILPKTIWYIL